MQTKRKNKKSLIILGSFLVLAGLTIFGYKYYEYTKDGKTSYGLNAIIAKNNVIESTGE